MNLRIALLAGTLALVGTAGHAEELQWTITGNVQCLIGIQECNGQATNGPGSVTFDLNTLSATLTPTFAHNPPGGPAGDILVNLDASFPITNYLAIVNGQTFGFAANGSGSLGCFGFPVGKTNYECSGMFSPSHGLGAYSFGDNETWIATLTEAQYKALKDPLAAILLSNTGPPGVVCSFGGGSICFMDQGPAGSVGFVSKFIVTPVPTPGPLALFLAALVGLALSRRRKDLVSPRPT
jgi:MYXO-CTERM domain-containing protein